MSAEDILARLEKVRKMGADRWIACCPAHADKSPSLTIREMPDGQVLLHCFADCGALAVLEAIGLDYSAAFPEKLDSHIPRVRQPFSAREALAALVPELMMVALIGRQMMAGIPNDEQTQQALITAVSRITSAHSYVEGL